MLSAKLVVLLAVASLFAQLHCATACAANSCGTDSANTSSVPPCHRHHDHSHERNPDSCPHQFVAPVASVQGLHIEMPLASVPGLPAAMSAVRLADMWSSDPAFAASSPPGLRDLSSTLLRI